MGFWDGVGSALLIPRKFGSSLVQQALVVPEVIYSAVRDQPVRRIPLMVSRISAEDVAWSLLVAYIHTQLDQAVRGYLEDSPEDAEQSSSYSWFCFYLFIQFVLLAVNGLAMAYTKVRKPLQTFVRSEILELEAGNTLVNIGDRGCRLIRLQERLESTSHEELHRLQGNAPAYAIHSRSGKAWFLDRQHRITELNPANFTRFKDQFPPAEKAGQFIPATRAQLDVISALTGRTHQHLPMTLCEEEKCGSPLNFLRNRTSYYVTGSLTWCMSRIGKTGHYITTALKMPAYAQAAFLSLWYVAEGMNIVGNGRLIQQGAIPELCADHQMVYLQEYVESSLAFGLSHWAMSEVIIRALQHVTGWPRELYEKVVREYMLLFSISIAAHMSKAPAVKTSTRWHDPVGALQGSADVALEIVRLGASKVLPPMFKDRPEGPSLAEWVARIKTAWEHPVARYLEFIFIPRLLRSKTAFTEDPVIAPSWEVVRQMMIRFLEAIEIIHKRLDVKAAAMAPGGAGKFANKFFGLPESMVTQLLIWLSNPEAMEACRAFRRYLFAMVPADIRNEDLDSIIDLPPLRYSDEPLTHPADRSEADASSTSSARTVEEAQLLILDHIRPIIPPAPAASSSSSSDVPENPVEAPGDASPAETPGLKTLRQKSDDLRRRPTPSDVILGARPLLASSNGFFASAARQKDPSQIILGKRPAW